MITNKEKRAFKSKELSYKLHNTSLNKFVIHGNLTFSSPITVVLVTLLL